MMSKIKGKDTQPEVKLRKELWKLGFRYRKNLKTLPGSPDIVLFKHKVIVFIDGEFWHGYNWDEKKLKIKSNRDFWIPKIERNIQRDKEISKILTNRGWNVIRIWELEIKKDIENVIGSIINLTNNSSMK